jgi:hypothetical protein
MSRTLKAPSSLKLPKHLARCLKTHGLRSAHSRSCPYSNLRRYRHGGTRSISDPTSNPTTIKQHSSLATATRTEARHGRTGETRAKHLDLTTSLTGVRPDQPAYLEYLRDQHRIRGHDAIRRAWWQLRQQNIDLPTDAGAIEIWALFMRVPSLREDVCRYAELLKRRTGLIFRPLYTLFMSRLICSGTEIPTELLLMHHRWFRTYYIPATAMEDLAPYAPVSTMALNAYYRLYVESYTKGTKAMYDCIVPTLCRQREWVLAFKFHRAITNNGIKVESNPIVDELNSNPTLKDAIYDRLWAISVEKEEKDPLESVALSDIELEQPSPPSPPPMSDAFASRLFATKSFPLSLIMAGLRLCKVTEIGPLSVRELLARVTSISDASDYLELLRRSGIRIAQSAYAETAMRILETNELPLLHDFLDCDLHPDTFEDVEAQRNLLKYYISQGELLAAKRTTIVLAVHEQRSNRNPWTHLFKSFCQNAKLPELSVLVDDMVMASLPLSRAAARLLSANSYPKTLKLVSDFERLVKIPFVANINILYLRCGMVPPTALYTYSVIVSGKLGHVDQAYRMLNYLGLTLGRGSQRPEARLLKTVTTDVPNIAVSLQRCLPPDHSFNAVTKLFGLKAIRGILTWGFKSGRRHLLTRDDQSGARVILLGLTCLKHLIRDGVQISPEKVAFILRWRFWVLYGFQPLRGDSNRISREVVRFSLEDLLWSINKIWPLKDLFPELFVSGTTGDPSKKTFLLDGLLQHPTKEGLQPALPERMRRRMRLRLRLYGLMPSTRHHKWAGRSISRREWHDWWLADAERADVRAIRGSASAKLLRPRNAVVAGRFSRQKI